MRLSLVVSSLSNGGAERVAAVLAGGFVGRGFRVQVLTYHPELTDDYPVPPEVKRVQLDFHTSGPGKIFRIRAALAEFAPDVVISFTNKVNVRTLLAGLGKPWVTVATEHNVPRNHPLSWKWEAARRLTYPWAQAVVGVSEGVLADFRYLSAPSRIVIPNPIPPHAYRRRPGTHHRIVAAGRLVEVKGFDLLLEAFAQAQLTGWSLDLWGDGPEREKLQEQAVALGLSDRVAFRGWTSEPLAELSEYDFLVLSSRSEGFGNVLTEALSVGLPVVSFDCPTGPRTIVRPGLNGLLVPAGNVPGLASAIRTLALDGALREKMGTQALEDAVHWSLPEVLDRWERVWNGLPR